MIARPLIILSNGKRTGTMDPLAMELQWGTIVKAEQAPSWETWKQNPFKVEPVTATQTSSEY